MWLIGRANKGLPYLVGMIFRPKRRILGMGVESLVVLILYVIGTVGLFAIATSGHHG